ncbi:MAG: hypothetical protein HETSPECPRED_002127 [Heterodermia speciosa]|uniref:Uncharacterized protein n=1 Tax=Heterodermia speciosa TaxID=116794 RepID=A0A8H3J3F6_9LECA|nr:MAG: hypothetical protein HETSPECPRED_002127 [Heterodermia speciosa]
MQAHLVGIIVGSTIAGTILCVALFFVLKCLRRRRREAIDEETSTISSQSTQDTQSSLTSAEQQAADYSAIYRRVVPCFAEGEYTGPSAREGKFVYGGSLLDNVQQPSAEDLARAGYEPVAAPGKLKVAARDPLKPQTLLLRSIAIHLFPHSPVARTVDRYWNVRALFRVRHTIQGLKDSARKATIGQFDIALGRQSKQRNRDKTGFHRKLPCQEYGLGIARDPSASHAPYAREKLGGEMNVKER